MDTARIADLLKPFLEGCPTSRGVRDVGSALSPTQLEQTSTYIDLLLRWNSRINLTAIREPEQIVTRHFGESFFLARHVFPASVERTLLSAPPPESSQLSQSPKPLVDTLMNSEAAPLTAFSAMNGKPAAAAPGTDALGVADQSSLTTPHRPLITPRVIDIGSGAGFPALPLKIWAPQIHLVLIESNHKKATFLREVTRTLTLTNVDVIADRAESVATRIGPTFPPADVVTFRAVEKFDQILPLAAQFRAENGRLALLISTSQLPKLESLSPLKWQSNSVPKSHSRLLVIA